MFAIFVLSHAIEEFLGAFTQVDQLSKSERHMLINLGIPRRMGKLAEALNTQPSTVTAVADSLEAKGLVLRERDPHDRRAWQLRLTESGEASRLRLIETTVTKFRELTGLVDQEIEQLVGIMDGVTERILQTGFPKGLGLKP
jgi:DNA-binding MarR family transcriptional regulator